LHKPHNKSFVVETTTTNGSTGREGPG
jgi:hypothetical protein